MAFTRESPRVPTSIGMFEFTVRTSATNTPQIISYRINVHDQYGEVMGTKEGDLLDHMSAVEKTNMLNFINTKRLLAESELL